MAEPDPAPIHEVAILRVSETARQDPHFARPQLHQDGPQNDGAAQGVGVPHPLGEDVDASATNGRSGPAQRVVRAVNLTQQVHALSRASAAEQRTVALQDDVRSRQPDGELQHLPLAGRYEAHPGARGLRCPTVATVILRHKTPTWSAPCPEASVQR